MQTEFDDPQHLNDEIVKMNVIIDRLALVTIETFGITRQEIIREQSRSLMELSTPVVKLWDSANAGAIECGSLRFAHFRSAQEWHQGSLEFDWQGNSEQRHHRQQGRLIWSIPIWRALSMIQPPWLATSVSELVRNALVHGGGGSCTIAPCRKDGCFGICVVIEDSGPGIADIEQAMLDGYTSNGGMGLGLPAARRLVHGMDIESRPGKTIVSIEMYLR